MGEKILILFRVSNSLGSPDPQRDSRISIVSDIQCAWKYQAQKVLGHVQVPTHPRPFNNESSDTIE